MTSGRYGTLWTYGVNGRYGPYGLNGLYGLNGPYGVCGRRRGAQITLFLIERTCILVCEHRAHVFTCKSRFRVFFLPRSFRRPRAFSPFPLKKGKECRRTKRTELTKMSIDAAMALITRREKRLPPHRFAGRSPTSSPFCCWLRS